jgi:hypothetical protein
MKPWLVRSWVRDAELEGVLNATPIGYDVHKMWRNRPGLDGQETTTIVWRAIDIFLFAEGIGLS